MSKIQKIDINLGQKIANPFRTSRNSSVTNPFKYSNFEGNTLQFADVFEGFESQKKANKLKLISSSVAGSMTKIRSIAEPIINFVNRVKCGISSAWDYAKNTNISDVKGLRTISHVMQMDITDIGKGISGSLYGIGKDFSRGFRVGLHDGMTVLNSDITDLGKGISSKWSEIISKINYNHTNKITKSTTVSELKSMWEAEIASGKEVA